MTHDAYSIYTRIIIMKMSLLVLLWMTFCRKSGSSQSGSCSDDMARVGTTGDSLMKDSMKPSYSIIRAEEMDKHAMNEDSNAWREENVNNIAIQKCDK